jgi:DNA mismatch repair protein MutH
MAPENMDIPENGRHLTREQILILANSIKGKTLASLGFDEWAAHSTKSDNKGAVGQFIEEGVFHIPNNNDPIPDFIDAGIELKTLGVRRSEQDDWWEAKERLPITKINFDDLLTKPFEESSAWHKCQKLLLVLYAYLDDAPVSSFPIVDVALVENYDPNTLRQFKDDYDRMAEFAKNGQFGRLREKNFFFLSVCGKGAAGSQEADSFNKPNQNKAYCLEKNFMTQLINALLPDCDKPENVFKTTEDYAGNLAAKEAQKHVQPYVGKTKAELISALLPRYSGQKTGIPKQINFMLLNAMFGTKHIETGTNAILASKYLIKNIEVQKSGMPKQSMSFPEFSFTEVAKVPFEDSDLYDMLSNQHFLVAFWRKGDDGLVRFQGLKIWDMPEEDIDSDVKAVYEQTANLLREGKALRYNPNGSIRDAFPKSNFLHRVCHVRPHTTKGGKEEPLPCPDKITGKIAYKKMCFWLNARYLKLKFVDKLPKK